MEGIISEVPTLSPRGCLYLESFGVLSLIKQRSLQTDKPPNRRSPDFQLREGQSSLTFLFSPQQQPLKDVIGSRSTCQTSVQTPREGEEGSVQLRGDRTQRIWQHIA